MNLPEIKYCPGLLTEGHETYSPTALKSLFNRKKVNHVLSFEDPALNDAEGKLLIEPRKQISISGVQAKFSLKMDGNELSLTDKGGQYILKPIPSGLRHASQIPANEHLTMQIANQVFKINTATNAMIFFSDGRPAYITKRFDIKSDGTKKRQEDLASVAGKTSENAGKFFKYDFNYNMIADLIKKHVPTARIEIINLYKLVLFNYLFSNADGHLKNFSFIETDDGDYVLSPAYDLLCTRIHVEEERDLAALEGLYKDDMQHPSYSSFGFYANDDLFEFGIKMEISEKSISEILMMFISNTEQVERMVERSFLSSELKKKYLELYRDKLRRFKMSQSGRM